MRKEGTFIKSERFNYQRYTKFGDESPIEFTSFVNRIALALSISFYLVVWDLGNFFYVFFSLFLFFTPTPLRSLNFFFKVPLHFF